VGKFQREELTTKSIKESLKKKNKKFFHLGKKETLNSPKTYGEIRRKKKKKETLKCNDCKLHINLFIGHC